jgi:hypothetical protein
LLSPLGLIALSTVVQAAAIVAALAWALGKAGLFDLQALAAGWLPAITNPGLRSLIETLRSAVSWFLVPPLQPGIEALSRASGVQLSGVFSWLLPGGLVLSITLGLALLYLGWLVAYWSVRGRPVRQVVPSAS